jgi:hypothetical protein
VRRARGYVEAFARDVAPPLAVDDRVHGALEHLEMLVLAWVVVLGRKPPASGVEGLHLEDLLADPQQLQPQPIASLELLSFYAMTTA